jgi:hypothetical protein
VTFFLRPEGVDPLVRARGKTGQSIAIVVDTAEIPDRAIFPFEIKSEEI